ncbi:MAG: hypothetical protein IM553_23255 [Microcystis sp. M57BS1]|jgi:predicted membrane protein|uniref:Uncharacterized protein n=1 Tax=Microcystis aeruginosa PCC 9443 TaxID=1160281 RepID=I4G606_MICAE|nr:hypothetical protein [Microcystis sp. M57BS1]MCA2563432.1 hypothetical protein [Microcystis sp. M40BS1]CCI03367.1 hypothetical protein MICAC_4500008 [Microcystis aeruginosa PCC 9443]
MQLLPFQNTLINIAIRHAMLTHSTAISNIIAFFVLPFHRQDRVLQNLKLRLVWDWIFHELDKPDDN